MTVSNLALSLFNNSQPLRGRIDTLTRQEATGLISSRFGDIALGARRTIDLRAEVASRATYAASIDRAGTAATVTQNALSGMADIARDFLSESTGLLPGDPVQVQAVAQKARQALSQVANLLNTRDGGTYVFGGSDSDNPPVPDAASIAGSGLVTQIASAVSGLTAGNAGDVAAATLAAARSDAAGTTVFSAFLSNAATGRAEARRSVATDDGQSVAYGLFANRNVGTVSTGETTGSWSRDLLRGLATLSALGATSVSQGDGFASLVQSVQGIFTSAVASLGVEAGVLGEAQTRLTSLKSVHSTMTLALNSQISDLTEVDFAATLTKLQAAQTQLQASYKVIAQATSLTLASFLK